MIVHLSEKEFDEKVLKNEKVVLVDFFATWCGPCQMLGPVLEQISQERNDFEIYKIDIDEEMNLAMNSKIEVVPTMLIYKNGQVVDKKEGFYSKSEIIENISKYL